MLTEKEDSRGRKGTKGLELDQILTSTIIQEEWKSEVKTEEGTLRLEELLETGEQGVRVFKQTSDKIIIKINE